jgi:hypothetical protein
MKDAEQEKNRKVLAKKIKKLQDEEKIQAVS